MSDPTFLITYAELTELEEDESAIERSREIARLLMGACNDWPVFNLQEPSALLDELHKEVFGELTFENLREYDDKLLVEREPWKKEALVALLEIFRLPTSSDFLKDVPLEVVLRGLK